MRRLLPGFLGRREVLPRCRGTWCGENRRRLLRDQIKRVGHVERIQGRGRPVHTQIRGISQISKVLEAPTPDAFAHKIVVLAKRIVEVEGLVAEAEEVRLRFGRASRPWRGGDLWEVPGPRRRGPGPGERLEPPERSVSKAARAQLILFCGRSWPETARTGSSRVYRGSAVVWGAAGARSLPSMKCPKNF